MSHFNDEFLQIWAWGGIAGAYDTSVLSFSENLLAVFPNGLTSYVPTVTVGGLPYLCVLCILVFVDRFDNGHCDQCEVIPHCIDWHWFNNYWCGVSFHVLLLFSTLWVQFTSWNWLLETWPCLEFFSPSLPQDITWEVPSTALSDLWLLRALQHLFYGFPAGSVVKNPPAAQETCRRHGFSPWAGKMPWRRKWQRAPVFLPENPMDRGAWWATVHSITKESGMT